MSEPTPKRVSRVYAVLGYGCHLTPALRHYLDDVGLRVRRDLGASAVADAVLFCSGGFTMQRSAPGVSEAQLMASYLRDRGVAGPAVLDETARTTLENLRNLALLCARHDISAEQVVICCDSARRAKIAHVARRLLGDAVRLWCFDLTRTRLQAATQRSLGLAYDALALRYPALERIGLRLIDARNAWL